tara:strand:- start:731 stop:1078 length:348 start_codon:yes stop_codon:yes gene_type:complete
MPIRKKIADKIKQKRSERLKKQEDVANQIGLSQSAYAKIENGATKIDMERLVKIAEVLAVSVVELLPKSLFLAVDQSGTVTEVTGEALKVEQQLHTWKDERIRQLEEELKRLKEQ